MNRGNTLSVGDVLNRVFELYKEHFGVLIPAAFWLFLIVSILSGIVGQHDVVLLLLVAVVSFAVAILYQGMVVSLVHDVQDGRRDSSVGELFTAVGPVLGPLIGASLLYGLGVGIGFFLLVVPGCILLTIWAVIAPAIVIEKRDVLAAFGRSRELVRGFGWAVFGTVIVATLVTIIVSIIVTSIAEAIAGGPILRIVFGALAATLTGAGRRPGRRRPLLPAARAEGRLGAAPSGRPGRPVGVERGGSAAPLRRRGGVSRRPRSLRNPAPSSI